MSQKTSAEEQAPWDEAANGTKARLHDGAPSRVRDRNRILGKRKDIQSLALLNNKTVEIYQDFYKEIFKGGAIDRRTKELIAIAASAISGCEGCLVGHLRKARALGCSEAEIKESVSIAFAVNAATVVDRTDVAQALATKLAEIEAQSPEAKD